MKNLNIKASDSLYYQLLKNFQNTIIILSQTKNNELAVAICKKNLPQYFVKANDGSIYFLTESENVIETSNNHVLKVLFNQLVNNQRFVIQTATEKIYPLYMIYNAPYLSPKHFDAYSKKLMKILEVLQ